VDLDCGLRDDSHCTAQFVQHRRDDRPERSWQEMPVPMLAEDQQVSRRRSSAVCGPVRDMAAMDRIQRDSSALGLCPCKCQRMAGGGAITDREDDPVDEICRSCSEWVADRHHRQWAWVIRR
jgi:hypothetical protein